MRSVFYISDSTAITSEVFGHALLSHFPIEFKHFTIPFVENIEKVNDVKEKINKEFIDSGELPLIFHTISNSDLSLAFNDCNCIIYNFLDHFVSPLEKDLGVKAKARASKVQGIHSIHESNYDRRIDAVNYALGNDDGSNITNYDRADLILIGVSRSGKTPTSLYLALQYGIKAANYPFIDDDMEDLTLPDFLKVHQKKLFGLTIDPQRLIDIRNSRLSNSKYASPQQCRLEIREVEKLYKKAKIPFINTTKLSIEEITAKILLETDLDRYKY